MSVLDESKRGILEMDNAGRGVIQPPAVNSGSSGSGGGILALITDSEGSVAPWIYSAAEAEISASGSVTAKSGGETYAANVFNISEIGTDAGVGKVPTGMPVVLYDGEGCWYFDKPWYRGSYG